MAALVAPLSLDPAKAGAVLVNPPDGAGGVFFFQPFAASPTRPGRVPAADPNGQPVVAGNTAWLAAVAGVFAVGRPGADRTGRPVSLPRAFVACGETYPATDPDGLVPLDPGPGVWGYATSAGLAPLPLAGGSWRTPADPHGPAKEFVGADADLGGTRGGDLYLYLTPFPVRSTDLGYPYFLAREQDLTARIRAVYGPRCRKLRLASLYIPNAADDGGVYPTPAALGLDFGAIVPEVRATDAFLALQADAQAFFSA